jgi:hypothetical protein
LGLVPAAEAGKRSGSMQDCCRSEARSKVVRARVCCRKQRKWLVGTMAAEARLVPENGLRVDSTGAQGVVWAMGFRTRRHSASGSPWLEKSIDISSAVSSASSFM